VGKTYNPILVSFLDDPAPLELGGLLCPVHPFGMQHLMFGGRWHPIEFLMGEMARCQHVQRIATGVGLPPLKIAEYVVPVRDDESTSVEVTERCRLAINDAISPAQIECGRKDASTDASDFLDVAVEPHFCFIFVEIGKKERVFVALSVCDPAAHHLLAECCSRFIQGVSKPLAVRFRQLSGERMKRLPINPQDHIGTLGKRSPKDVFVFCFQSIAKYVRHVKSHPSVPPSTCEMQLSNKYLHLCGEVWYTCIGDLELQNPCFLERECMKAQSHGSEAPTHSSFVSAAETQRLVALEQEQKTLAERMRQIQVESEALYASLRSRIAPEFIGASGLAAFQKRQPEHPRPLNDKLVISAGRAIVAGLRRGLQPAQSREEAVQAATKVAKRYGMTSLPDMVLTAIDKKIKSRYNIYPPALPTQTNVNAN
jgi:hypothetical protein